jgi:hypothetical protein
VAAALWPARSARPGCSDRIAAAPFAFSRNPQTGSNPLDRCWSKVMRSNCPVARARGARSEQRPRLRRKSRPKDTYGNQNRDRTSLDRK